RSSEAGGKRNELRKGSLYRRPIILAVIVGDDLSLLLAILHLARLRHENEYEPARARDLCRSVRFPGAVLPLLFCSCGDFACRSSRRPRSSVREALHLRCANSFG